MDPVAILNRLKELTLTPKPTWENIKAEISQPVTLYKELLLPLGLFAFVFQFASVAIRGLLPTSIIISLIFGFIIQMAAVYVMSVIMQKLSSYFNCSPSFEDCFKLNAYSIALSFAGSVLGILPFGIGILLSILFSLYCFYVFYVGFPIITEVPEVDKVKYFLTYIVVAILVWIVLGVFIMGSIAAVLV